MQVVGRLLTGGSTRSSFGLPEVLLGANGVGGAAVAGHAASPGDDLPAADWNVVGSPPTSSLLALLQAGEGGLACTHVRIWHSFRKASDVICVPPHHTTAFSVRSPDAIFPLTLFRSRRPAADAHWHTRRKPRPQHPARTGAARHAAGHAWYQQPMVGRAGRVLV